MATSKKTASKKELTIVAIYKFKSHGKLNGTRCTLVRNGEGEEYQVWTHSNGCSSSCTCEGFQKWHKKCYHIKCAEARQSVAAKPVATPAPVVVEPVATPVASVETPVVAQPKVTAQPVIETTATKEAATVAASAEPVKADTQRQADLDAASARRMNAPLTGNQGFSLLKKAS